MTGSITTAGPNISIPLPTASSWVVRIPRSAKIRPSDLQTLANDAQNMLGGADDIQWWIEGPEGQVFGRYGVQALASTLGTPYFDVVGFAANKHIHPGSPNAHGMGPHPATTTLRSVVIDLRLHRAIVVEGNDPTWVVGARTQFATRVGRLPQNWIWTRRATVVALALPSVTLGAVAYWLLLAAGKTAPADLVSGVPLGLGVGFLIGGQVLELWRRMLPAAFGGNLWSSWLTESWVALANLVAAVLTLAAAAAVFVR